MDKSLRTYMYCMNIAYIMLQCTSNLHVHASVNTYQGLFQDLTAGWFVYLIAIVHVKTLDSGSSCISVWSLWQLSSLTPVSSQWKKKHLHQDIVTPFSPERRGLQWVQAQLSPCQRWQSSLVYQKYLQLTQVKSKVYASLDSYVWYCTEHDNFDLMPLCHSRW